MKKIIFLLTFATLTLSCRSTDDSVTPVAEVPILPTKIIENGDVSTLTYDGAKLKEIVGPNSQKLVFVYDGDYISKINLYEGGVISSTTTYTYTGGKLVAKKAVDTDGSHNEDTSYNYISDNQINVIINYTYKNGGVTNYNKYNTTYYLLGGNIYKQSGTIQDSSSNSPVVNGTISTDVTFDSKNNPFKNITGFSKLIDIESYINSNINNITKYDSKSVYTNGTGYTYYTSEYTYNSNNYPTKVVRTNKVYNGTTTDVDYFEYNK